MEKKLITLTLVALLAGLGGGFGVGYLFYQPQIQNLQNDANTFRNDLNNLNNRLDTINLTLRNTQSTVNVLNPGMASINSTIEGMKNKTWHRVSSLEGPPTVVSGTFEIKGESIRIQWVMYGSALSAIIQVHIKYSNTTVFADSGSSGAFGSFSSDIAYRNPPGEYYIDVDGFSLVYYQVVVWDYY